MLVAQTTEMRVLFKSALQRLIPPWGTIDSLGLGPFRN